MTFLAYIALHNLTEKMAIQMLPFYLLGVAKQWFINLGDASKATISQVREAFFQRFIPTAHINKEVVQVKHFVGEKVDRYLFRVRTLAADRALHEKLVTFFVVEGLKDICSTPESPDIGRTPSVGHPSRISSWTDIHSNSSKLKLAH